MMAGRNQLATQPTRRPSLAAMLSYLRWCLAPEHPPQGDVPAGRAREVSFLRWCFSPGPPPSVGGDPVRGRGPSFFRWLFARETNPGAADGDDAAEMRRDVGMFSWLCTRETIPPPTAPGPFSPDPDTRRHET